VPSIVSVISYHEVLHNRCFLGPVTGDDTAKLEDEIDRLEKMRLWSAVLLLVFLVAPSLVAVPILVCAEAPANSGLSNYYSALGYAVGVATRSRISNATVVTPIGQAVTVVLSLFNLIFFGFISSIVMTSIQIHVTASKLPKRVSQKEP